MVPNASSWLNDCRRTATDEVWEKNPVGAFEPSLIRKSGSVPLVALKMALMRAVEMPRPSSSLWQLLQVRPLMPRFWKNGLAVSMLPVDEKTSAVPNGLENALLLMSD
jgi:hypothetical protein